MRASPRTRRLHADYRALCQLRDESSIFTFECTGSPPKKYELIFHGAGFYRDPASGKILLRDRHRVSVELTAAYPRLMPGLSWKTPTFHPNISNNGVVCLGGYGTHWVPSLTLAEMATMLWDMIRYKNFDSESPYNRDAASWTKSQSDYSLPIDKRSIRDRLTHQTSEIPNVTKPPKTKQPANQPTPWKILSQQTSTEPALPESSQPLAISSAPPTATTSQNPPTTEATDHDGVHIIEARLAEPENDEQTSHDSGILFIN